MVQLRGLSVSFGAVQVLNDVSLSLDTGEVVALVGPNGAGKSTLLGCLTGALQPDAGAVVLNAGTTLAHLPQEETCAFEGTAFERGLFFHPPLLSLFRDIQAGRYAQIAEYSALDGYGCEDRVRMYAANFGVADALDRPYEDLSRGMRRKVDLVGMFCSGADVLIFDEPINFLDIRGITAFEEGVKALKARGRSLLLVSHDRELIDQVADQTVFLARGKLTGVHGGYSQALAHRAQEFQAEVDRAADLNRKIARLQAAMRRRMGWGIQREHETTDSSSRRLAAKVMKGAKVMARRLEKQKAHLEAEKPWIEKPVALQMPVYDVGRRSVVRFEGVGKSFGDVQVIRSTDLALDTHDRLAIMGANGAGKTTLLQLMLGRLQPDGGMRSTHAGVKVGEIPQGLEGFYTREIFLENFLDTGHPEHQIRQYLGAAKLRREKVLQPVETLSYGERMRGAVVRMMLERADFLVMDEPTTHLDIESVEVLESLLSAFPGGFVVVSHDRRFVSAVAREIYMLEAGALRRL